MTTFDPGASEVLTHGLRCRPRSTAFFASSAAPTMTDGFDVLVHDVMAAMTTAPWSSSNSVPSESRTRAGLDGLSPLRGRALGTAGRSASVSREAAGGLLAGQLSLDDSSTLPLPLSVSST